MSKTNTIKLRLYFDSSLTYHSYSSSSSTQLISFMWLSLSFKRIHFGQLFFLLKQFLWKTPWQSSQVTAFDSKGYKGWSLEQTSQIWPRPLHISQSTLMCLVNVSIQVCILMNISPECTSTRSCRLYIFVVSNKWGTSISFHSKWSSLAIRHTRRYFLIPYRSFLSLPKRLSSWTKLNSFGFRDSRFMIGLFEATFSCWRVAWHTGLGVKSQLCTTRAGIIARLFQWQPEQ